MRNLDLLVPSEYFSTISENKSAMKELKLEKSAVYRSNDYYPKNIDDINLYKWSLSVRAQCKYRCSILNRPVKTLHCHHLFSKAAFPLLKYVPENGIAIDVNFHKEFHHRFGHKTTLDDFLIYLTQLEISENTSLDMANLKKLKNYLISLGPILNCYLRKFPEFSQITM